MRNLITLNKHNRAQTVLAAVKQVYLLRGDPLPAHDTAPSGRLEKLSARAAQLQQEAIAVKGTGKPTMTMCLRKLHEYINTKLSPTVLEEAPYGLVRTACQLNDRIAGAGRPQDPHGRLAGTEDFFGADSFETASAAGVRIYDTKGVKGARMSQHVRPPPQQQNGKLASETTWHRTSTKGVLAKPPYFDLIAEYYRRREQMKIVYVLSLNSQRPLPPS